MPQPCPRKLRPIALAEVLMKLAESCVIEQHIGRLFKGVEPTNLGLGTPDAAALIVPIVRGWANDMAVAPKGAQDADVVLPIDLENASGWAFRSTSLEAARTACPQIAAICAAQREPVTQGSGSNATMAGLRIARQEGDGKVRGPCKLCSCLDWSLPSPCRMTWAHGRSRGLACRMT